MYYWRVTARKKRGTRRAVSWFRTQTRRAAERGPKLGRDAQRDGLGQRPDLIEQVVGVVRADVGDDVTDLTAGAEQLGLDVQLVVGEDAVDGGHDARDVAVDEDQPMRVRRLRQRDTRQVDAHRGGALYDEVAELAGHEASDVLLGLLGRAADVRGQDDVRQSAQLADELVAALLRLHREHVDRRTGDVARLDVRAQRRVVDDEAPRQVEKQAAGAHLSELRFAEEVVVGRPPVDMQRHHVGLAEQVAEGLAAVRVTEREPVGGVEEQHAHAEILGQHRQLRADVAVPDDAQRATAYLVRAVGRLVPDARMHQGVLVREPPGQRDDLGDRELDHAAGVGERRVEDGDAPLRGCLQVDLVGADAERADREQLGRGVQDALRDVRLGADAQQGDRTDPVDQLVLVERAVERLDLEVGGAQHRHGVRMDLFEQKYAYRAVGHAASSHAVTGALRV